MIFSDSHLNIFWTLNQEGINQEVLTMSANQG